MSDYPEAIKLWTVQKADGFTPVLFIEVTDNTKTLNSELIIGTKD